MAFLFSSSSEKAKKEEKKDLFGNPISVDQMVESKRPAPGEVKKQIVSDLLREIKQREERAQRTGKEFKKVI